MKEGKIPSASGLKFPCQVLDSDTWGSGGRRFKSSHPDFEAKMPRVS